MTTFHPPHVFPEHTTLRPNPFAASVFMMALAACACGRNPEPVLNQQNPTSPHTPPAHTASAQGDADVTHVRAVQNPNGTWTFHVTVQHADTGWDDYANGWDVVLPDTTVLRASGSEGFTRLLGHPHVQEQPFTRNASGLVIPDGVTHVIVRAHEIVHGYGGAEVVVDLNALSGEGFSVEHSTLH